MLQSCIAQMTSFSRDAARDCVMRARSGDAHIYITRVSPRKSFAVRTSSKQRVSAIKHLDGFRGLYSSPLGPARLHATIQQKHPTHRNAHEHPLRSPTADCVTGEGARSRAGAPGAQALSPRDGGGVAGPLNSAGRAPSAPVDKRSSRTTRDASAAAPARTTFRTLFDSVASIARPFSVRGRRVFCSVAPLMWSLRICRRRR